MYLSIKKGTTVLIEKGSTQSTARVPCPLPLGGQGGQVVN